MTNVTIDFNISPEEIMALYQECQWIDLIKTPDEIKLSIQINTSKIYFKTIKETGKIPNLDIIKDYFINDLMTWIIDFRRK